MIKLILKKNNAMKKLVYLLLIVTLSVSACKSNKDIADQNLEQYDNFDIGKIHYDVANHLELNQERTQAYFDVLVNTEKMAKALDDLNPTKSDRTFGLKEIKKEQLAQLNELFTKEEIIKYNKFMRNNVKESDAKLMPKQLDTKLD